VILIISISIVSCVKFEIILLQFQLKSFFFISESQPSAVLNKLLERVIVNAPEGALGTQDCPQAVMLFKPEEVDYTVIM